jgi:hypothetical protein
MSSAVPEFESFPDEPVADIESRRFTLVPLLFVIFFLLLNFHTVTYLGLEKEDLEATKISDSQIRYYHWFSLAFALPLMWWLPSLRIPTIGVIYFACAIGSSLFASLAHHNFSYRIVTLFFAAYCFLLGIYFSHLFSRQWLETTVRRVFLVFHLAVLAKLLYYMVIGGGGIPRTPFGRPAILYFSAGGNNLEVTWLALSSVFFLTQYKFWPVSANSFVTSLMYSSRVGMLLSGMATVWKLFRVKPVLSFLVLGVTAPLLLVLIALSGIDFRSSEVVERFMNIGDKSEYGSQSRMELWTASFDLLRSNPWGHGVGAGMEEVKDVLQQSVHQNNVHNIYLQIAIDCGVQTLLCFLILMFDIARKWYRGGAMNAFGTFVLFFLVPGLIEFTGQEAMMWMFVGIFYGTINAPDEKEDFELEEEQITEEDLETEDPAKPAEAEEPVVVSKITR